MRVNQILEGSTEFVITTYYEFSHHRRPRGYGRWAFSLDTQHPNISDIIWRHGLYSEIAREMAKEFPNRVIYVLP